MYGRVNRKKRRSRLFFHPRLTKPAACDRMSVGRRGLRQRRDGGQQSVPVCLRVLGQRERTDLPAGAVL